MTGICAETAWYPYKANAKQRFARPLWDLLCSPVFGSTLDGSGRPERAVDRCASMCRMPRGVRVRARGART